MILPDSALALTHYYAEQILSEGVTAVDATAGNGYDTLFMAQRVGSSGKIYSFDIQQSAINNTAALLEKNDMKARVTLIKDGHQNMQSYISSASLIMFNLGYLPGGNHSVSTRAETTIAAISSALEIIERGGIITIGIYYGKDSGFDEKNAVLEYLKTIDLVKFNVILHDYINRPNCPPLAVVIEKK